MATESGYEGLHTAEVLGTNLAGKDKSTACTAFKEDVALLAITGHLQHVSGTDPSFGERHAHDVLSREEHCVVCKHCECNAPLGAMTRLE
jgi:hypothetical protein